MAKTYPASEGMRKVFEIVKLKYLAEHLEGTPSFVKVWLSFGAKHIMHNGKPSYYTEKQVRDLQGLILSIGAQLFVTNVTPDTQEPVYSPYCYGDDFVSKFKVLGKVIKLPYLFKDVLDKTEKWQKMHLSQKDSPYYNKFADYELEMINDGIHEIGQMLMDITLEYEKPEPTQQSDITDEESLQAWEEEMAVL